MPIMQTTLTVRAPRPGLHEFTADVVRFIRECACEQGLLTLFVRHGLEGPDDMPGHIKAALTATSLSIPVMAGQLVLGRWQGIFLFEHRDRSPSREVVLHLSQ